MSISKTTAQSASQQPAPPEASLAAKDTLPRASNPNTSSQTLTKKAVSFIEETAADKQPFFLYYPVTGPHTPIAPNKAFTGKSQAGKYGDFVVECDWAVGQIMDAVEKAGATDNTLFIVH